MLIAGPLIRVLGDRYGWHVKVATLEALVQLVRKVRLIIITQTPSKLYQISLCTPIKLLPHSH